MDPPITQDADFRSTVRKSKRTLFWTGIAYVVFGVVALLFPVLSTFASTLTIGWLLLLVGGVTLFQSFSYRGAGPFFGAFLTGLLGIGCGLYTITHPGVAILVLTVFIAVLFLTESAFHTVMAFEMRPQRGWGWLLFSALISAAAGLLIIAEFPGTSLVILGVLVGINFFSSGLSMMSLSRSLS